MPIEGGTNMYNALLMIYQNSGEEGMIALYGIVAFLAVVLIVCWLLKYGSWFRRKK